MGRIDLNGLIYLALVEKRYEEAGYTKGASWFASDRRWVHSACSSKVQDPEAHDPVCSANGNRRKEKLLSEIPTPTV
jgi:hypothetical protein